MKQRLMMGLATSLLVAAMLPGVAAARVDGGCPSGTGWEPFQVFVDDVFQLEAYLDAYPNNQAAIDDGIYTEEELEAQWRAGDRNGNGWVCIKDVHELNGGNGQGFSYYVSGVDDNAAA